MFTCNPQAALGRTGTQCRANNVGTGRTVQVRMATIAFARRRGFGLSLFDL